jgi:hypothetical protein
VCLVAGEAPGAGAQAAGAEVVEIVSGVPGAVHKVTGVSGLDGISCAGAAGCEATGFAKTGDVAVAISPSGAGGQLTTVPALAPSISCSGPSVSCEAITTGSTAAAVIPIKAGVAGTAHKVPLSVGSGSYFSGAAISCWAASSCEAVVALSTAASVASFAVPVVQGVPGTPTKLSGTYVVTGISCPAAGQCVVAGSGRQGGAMVASLSGGHIGPVHAVPQASDLSAISCSSFAACVAVGSTASAKNPTGKAIVVPVSRGTPGTGAVVSAATNLDAVATAPGGFYEAVGQVQAGMNTGNDVVVSN